MGVTIAHFLGGDQNIACLHSVLIPAQVSLHFLLERINFVPHLPSSSGVTTTHFPSVRNSSKTERELVPEKGSDDNR